MKIQNSELHDKLEICKQTRKIAADALYKVLKELLASNNPISEVTLRDAWLTEMHKNKNIFPEGWYMPPPYGMIVLFGTDNHVERVNYQSARPQEKWPRDDIFLDKKNGLIYCYASPVNKKTGIIGDFGVTLYFGKDNEIRNLLIHCFEADKTIFEALHLDMQLGEVAEISIKILKNYELQNETLAITDKGENVLGHTIPDGFDDWTEQEKNIYKQKNWQKIKDIISKKRINVKNHESTIIKENSAITIEPRPKNIRKPDLPKSLSYHTIALFKSDRSTELLTGFDELFTLTGMDYMIEPMKKQNSKITYSQVGDNYDTKDPIKLHAQKAAKETGKNLLKHGFEEISDSRGESAYVWKQGKIYMASVIEGLGTKNLIADGTRKFTKKTHYDQIAHDTVATIINDLITVGAQPLVVHAYWAIEDNDWLSDNQRMTDLINGWKQACDIAGVSWGGGETATMKQIIMPNTCELGGAAIGIISEKKRLITDKKLKVGDRILLIKSNGVNANGISLTRAIANKVPNGYATKLKDGTTYGESLLQKSNIYAKLIQDLLNAGIDIHYVSNITGHGMRKIMRARQNVTYVIEKIFEPQELFNFIQQQAGLSEYEMYDTYNMGQDYAIFLTEKDIKKAQQIVKKNGFESLDAGYIQKGERQVIIEPKNITFKGETLKVRI